MNIAFVTWMSLGVKRDNRELKWLRTNLLFFRLTTAMEMTPLRPPQWLILRQKTVAFLAEHPGVDVLGLKEAYSMASRADHHQAVNALGCSHCDKCREWTASWCETCEGSS